MTKTSVTHNFKSLHLIISYYRLSSSHTLPRQGHLEQVYHIFDYPKKHTNAKMVFDLNYSVVGAFLFRHQDWSKTEFATGSKEEVIEDIPETRDFGFVAHNHVDIDHAGDYLTRRSRTGFLLYLDSSPVYWLFKK